MLTKMLLPSKIITKEELQERHDLFHRLVNENNNDRSLDYVSGWNRLAELNQKHLEAILYVTAYN